MSGRPARPVIYGDRCGLRRDLKRTEVYCLDGVGPQEHLDIMQRLKNASNKAVEGHFGGQRVVSDQLRSEIWILLKLKYPPG